MSEHPSDFDLNRIAHQVVHGKQGGVIESIESLLGLVTNPQMKHVWSCRGCKKKVVKAAAAEKAAKAAFEAHFLPIILPRIEELVHELAGKIVSEFMDAMTAEVPVPRKIIEAMAERAKSDVVGNPEVDRDDLEESLGYLKHYLEIYYPTLN